METFSALLVLCEGNSPVTGELPSQRPVTLSFDVFFNCTWTNNHEAGDLRRHRAHYDVIVMCKWSQGRSYMWAKRTLEHISSQKLSNVTLLVLCDVLQEIGQYLGNRSPDSLPCHVVNAMLLKCVINMSLSFAGKDLHYLISTGIIEYPNRFVCFLKIS